MLAADGSLKLLLRYLLMDVAVAIYGEKKKRKNLIDHDFTGHFELNVDVLFA